MAGLSFTLARGLASILNLGASVRHCANNTRTLNSRNQSKQSQSILNHQEHKLVATIGLPIVCKNAQCRPTFEAEKVFAFVSDVREAALSNYTLNLGSEH